MKKIKRHLSINVYRLVSSFAIVFIYFLFDRSLNLYYISSNDTLSSIYTSISEVAFVAVCLYFVSHLIKYNSIQIYSVGIIIGFFIFAMALLLSTFVNDGNIRRWFSMVYPVLGSLLYMSISCSSIEKTKKFVNAVSNLYLLLFIINLFYMTFFPDIFGANRFFVSIKNQVALPLTFGFFFASLDCYFNMNKVKMYLYVVVHILTSVFAFSGGGIICMVFIYLCFFIKPISKLLESIPLSYIIIFFTVIIIFITSGLLSMILNLPFVKYIIVDLLGKNLTLTNRTYIWENLIEMLSGKYLLGNGVQDSVNLFYFNMSFIDRISFVGTYSAHNQFLQTLYEGGIVSLSIMLMIPVLISRKLENISDKNVKKIIKISIVAVIIVLFDEAAGFITYFQIIQISALLICTLEKNQNFKKSV